MKQTQTSVKIATLTGAAKDDTFNGIVYEDGGSHTLDVLANDPGAARLYSVDQGAGALAGTAQFPVTASAVLASGASVSIVAGTLVYDAAGAFQSLGAGVVGYDHFVYTVRMGNGALSTAVATVEVTGVNDPASITGTDSGAASEDGTLTAGGQLTVHDVDTGENVFAAVASTSLAGTYGDFTFSGGAWTYTLRNGDANVQGLRGAEQVSDSLQVGSHDGTASATIAVTVTGLNDPATITGTRAGAVSEDGTLTAGAQLTVNDVDHGENVFAAVASTALAGTYGDFTFDAGAWTYTLRNADANVQSLRGGQEVSDSLQVGSQDGTAAATIAVTVTGRNDPASISGTASGDVTEDGTLTAGGTLAVSDVDTGENVFAAVNPSALVGTYGDFTFDAGAWTYLLRNGDANVQALISGQSVSDTLAVGSADGSASQNITVTIRGTNEPVIQQEPQTPPPPPPPVSPPPPPPPPQDPVYLFSLNRNNVTGGESAIPFVNGIATLTYFTGNDSVTWKNQDFTSITEAHAGGNTLVSYQWQTGNNSGTVTLTLVGVADVVISGNTLTMAT